MIAEINKWQHNFGFNVMIWYQTSFPVLTWISIKFIHDNFWLLDLSFPIFCGYEWITAGGQTMKPSRPYKYDLIYDWI